MSLDALTEKERSNHYRVCEEHNDNKLESIGISIKTIERLSAEVERLRRYELAATEVLAHNKEVQAEVERLREHAALLTRCAEMLQGAKKIVHFKMQGGKTWEKIEQLQADIKKTLEGEFNGEKTE